MNEHTCTYALVRYGRSTLLCRALAGSVTLQAVARFDDEGEARRALGHVIGAACETVAESCN